MKIFINSLGVKRWLSKWSKDDFSTGLISDYIDCKYFCVSLQRKSFTDTFWQPQFSIWQLQKKISAASWWLLKNLNKKFGP